MYQCSQLDPPVGAGVTDVRTELPPDESSVRTARGITRRHLTIWGRAAHSEAAELLVSELVTNAVRHAPGGPIRLTLTLRPAGLRGEVEDAGADLPLIRPSSAEDESGRGLLLVEHIATRWGCRPSGGGKAVWFDIDT